MGRKIAQIKYAVKPEAPTEIILCAKIPGFINQSTVGRTIILVGKLRIFTDFRLADQGSNPEPLNPRSRS